MQSVNIIGKDATQAELVDQVVVQDRNGVEISIPLHKGERPEQLRAKLAKFGMGEFRQAWLNCYEPNFPEFKALVQAALPDTVLEERPSMEPGLYRSAGKVRFEFDHHYFRALAKIAFHYYLVDHPYGMKGDEPGFEGIRQFIMAGRDPAQFFLMSPDTLVPPSKSIDRISKSTRWCHLLAAGQCEGIAFASVLLFASQECCRQPHFISLGRTSGRVIPPTKSWRTLFTYDQEQSDRGYAGSVFESP